MVFTSIIFFAECETPKSIEEEEDASDSIDMTGEREKRPVNKLAIASGMKRLTFLMDCCNPGTVPDAEFLAAALDLVNFLIKYCSLFGPFGCQSFSYPKIKFSPSSAVEHTWKYLKFF